MFNYRDMVKSGGVPALLTRDWAGGPTPTVRGAVAEEFIQRLETGKFRQALDAQAWIKKRTCKTLNRLYPNLRRLEDHLFAPSREWTQPAKVAGLIHRWLADQANAGAPT